MQNLDDDLDIKGCCHDLKAAAGCRGTYKAIRATKVDISARLTRYWISVALARCMAAGVSPERSCVVYYDELYLSVHGMSVHVCVRLCIFLQCNARSYWLHE